MYIIIMLREEVNGSSALLTKGFIRIAPPRSGFSRRYKQSQIAKHSFQYKKEMFARQWAAIAGLVSVDKKRRTPPFVEKWNEIEYTHKKSQLEVKCNSLQ